jgi:hypothetical protein
LTGIKKQIGRFTGAALLRTMSGGKLMKWSLLFIKGMRGAERTPLNLSYEQELELL